MSHSPPSSPGSSLSSLESIDFAGEAHTPERDVSVDDVESRIGIGGTQPPAKRRRLITYNPLRDPYNFGTPSNAPFQPADDDLTDVSSDTTGSAPGSPSSRQPGGAIPDEEALGAEQMRTCGWEGCIVGELDNLDELVRHVHDDHIGNVKRSRYTCEWSDCRARSKTQMSAYALRAHMRSHTKEKPFYCALPECDRSFTRSDALAKHMRTVHETESLRTAEHYAKTYRGGGPHDSTTPPASNIPPPKSLKLVFGSSKPTANSNDMSMNGMIGDDTLVLTSDAPLSPSALETLLGPLPSSLAFTGSETSMPRQQLFRLLRRQIFWAEEEGAELAQQVEEGERLRREEWLAKELVLENLMEAGYMRARKRGVFADKMTGTREGGDMSEDNGRRTRARRHKAAVHKRMVHDVRLAEALPVSGTTMPWYREADVRAGGGEIDGTAEEDIPSSPAGPMDPDDVDSPQEETMDMGDEDAREFLSENHTRGASRPRYGDGPTWAHEANSLREASPGADDTEEDEAD